MDEREPQPNKTPGTTAQEVPGGSATSARQKEILALGGNFSEAGSAAPDATVKSAAGYIVKKLTLKN